MRTDEAEAIAIVGAGMIGVGWAIVFACARHPVAVHDPDPQRLTLAITETRELLEDLAQGDLLVEMPEKILARLTMHGELKSALEEAVYVQECAPEDLELKRELFSRLDWHSAPEAVLAEFVFDADLNVRDRLRVGDAASSSIQGIHPTCFQSPRSFQARSQGRRR